VRAARGVKEYLTTDVRQEYLDVVNAESASVDPVTVKVLEAARRLIEHQESPREAVAAARELSAAADETLQAAVDRARAAGQSWREIGDVLGTTRQAAFQRFGHPLDPRTGIPMSREVPVGATERAVSIFAWHNEGRWDDILAELDGNMSERLDADRLSRGWAGMVGMFGQLERLGEPWARRIADDIVVDIPLHFEAGDAKGIVRFGADGKIAGLAIRRESP
jgi:hypothetical protein